MIRIVIYACLLSSLSLPAFNAAMADPGTAPERVGRASELDEGYGAIVISLRSEMYLDEPLQVFFLREGGDRTNDEDVIRFERRQSFFAFGNDTTNYKVRTFQLRPGTYRLIAHGMDCPTIPDEEERCRTDVQVLGIKQEFSRPSRGYGEIAPRFEVRAGAVTYAGDFALTARNTVEWSQIPAEHLGRAEGRFGAMPRAEDPIVPGEFRLRYGLTPRSFNDDRRRQF